MTWKHRLAKSLNRFGYDLRRYRADSHPLARREKLMETFGIDLVLDVGANAGQFGEELLGAGYRGELHSFEPLKDAFVALSAAAAGSNRWSARHCALGAERGTQVIHVAGNSVSSSLLNMLPSHESLAPDSKYIRDQEILVETLDEILPDIAPSNRSIWLKIDTQGFEHKVIAGARESLGRIDTVQMEISLTPLYEGALSVTEMIALMCDQGYSIVDVESEFCDQTTGRVLQVNVTFHRD